MTDALATARPVTVVAAERLTPHTQRITFTAGDFAGFAFPRGVLGPYVKLFLPAEPGDRPAWPSWRPDEARLIWPEGRPRAAMRTYTVRSADPAGRRFAIDFVLHEPASGPASRWATAAQPGDVIGLRGPIVLPYGGDTDWFLFAGDHSALPAIAFSLETLPTTARGLALVEIEDAADLQPLAHPGIEVRRLVRNGGPSRLAEAFSDATLPGGCRGMTWAGAEAAIARPIRRHARQALGLPPERCHVLNYWKRGEPEGGFGYIE